jgi:hypothetical protein
MSASCYTDVYAESVRQSAPGGSQYGYDEIFSELIVPPLPTSAGVNFALWNGTYANQSYLLFQPVLQYYEGASGWQWYIASWVVDTTGGGGTAHSPEVAVNPGDLLWMSVVQNAATLITVTAEDNTSGLETAQTYTGTVVMNNAQIAFLEIQGTLCSCSEMSANYGQFFNVRLYSQSAVAWNAFQSVPFAPDAIGTPGESGTYIDPPLLSSSAGACGWSIGWGAINPTPGSVASLGLYVQ